MKKHTLRAILEKYAETCWWSFQGHGKIDQAEKEILALTEKPEKVFTTTDQARKSLKDVKFLDNNEVFRKPKPEKWCTCGALYGVLRCLPQDIHRVFCKLCKREIKPTEIKPKNSPKKIKRLRELDYDTADFEDVVTNREAINFLIDRHNDEGGA